VLQLKHVPITTGGKTRLGRITKMGDRYLRKLLVVGACATLRHRRGNNDAMRLWASGMSEPVMNE
jgi:transposase